MILLIVSREIEYFHYTETQFFSWDLTSFVGFIYELCVYVILKIFQILLNIWKIGREGDQPTLVLRITD